MNKEHVARTLPGIPVLLGLIAATIGIVAVFVWYIAAVLEPVGDSAGLAEILPLIGLIVAFIAVMALAQLSAKNVVELDEERKAQMVSNLLVVLCSEHETQPVVNTGTLYA